MREMRRKNQLLSNEECIAVLNRGTSGTLALLGDDDYPYAVPLSYVYVNNKLFFHSSGQGHKIDAINKNGKASFCVIDQDEIIPNEYTTYFRSVILFGKVRIIEDMVEKRNAIDVLARKYSPNENGRDKEIDKSLGHVCMIELSIEHMSGKEAIELVRIKNK